MTQQIVNNGDGGLVARNKINDNFTELYGNLVGNRVTSVNVQGGSTGLTFAGGPITSSGTITMAGVLGPAFGGTGISATPSNGQVLIGNGTGFSLATLTAGSNVTITNGPGTITISASGGGGGGGGTVTSVNVSGGTTGLSFSGGPITTSGTITASGTLAIANGGTGQTTATAGFDALAGVTSTSFGRARLAETDAASFRTSIGAGTVTSVGGTGTVNGLTLTGTVTSSGSLTLGGTLSGVSLTSAVTGTLPIANGGTGTTTVPTNGQLLIGNGTGYTVASLTAGSNITITPGAGSITIAATGGGGGSPGGSTTQVQYNNAGAFAGASNVLIEGNELRLPAISQPTTPAASGLKLYGKSYGDRIVPTSLGPSGFESMMQSSLAFGRTGWVFPALNTTTITSVGIGALTGTGTVTGASLATTNMFTSTRRVDYLQTVASTSNVAGLRLSTGLFFRGNGTAGVGGFMATWVVGPATGPSTTAGTMRFFAGVFSSGGAPTDVDPSSLTNIVGFGCDAADTQMQIIYNDASGTASKIPLGSSFPKPTADREDFYEVTVFCAPNDTGFTVRVLRKNTGDVYQSAKLTTDIPTNTQGLLPLTWCSVGGTNSVVGLTFFGFYTESFN